MPTTAYLVDANNANNDPTFPFQGPFHYNGNDYDIGFSSDGLGHAVIGIFKSDDQPATTFTALDFSNSPIVRNFTAYWPVLEGVFQGTEVYVAYWTSNNPSNSVTIQIFDLVTETWGSPITTGAPVVSASPMALSVHGGVWKLFYYVFSSGAYHVNYSIYNGSWGSPVSVATLSGFPNLVMVGATNVSNGDFAACWDPTDTQTSLEVAVLSATLSSPVTLSGIKLVGAYSGIYLPDTDEFAFPFVNFNNIDRANQIDLLRVSPSTNPTIATDEAVVPETGNADTNLFPSISLGPDSKIYIFYQLAVNATSSSQIYATSRLMSGVTWSVPALLFDSNIDSFSPPQPVGAKEANQPLGSLYPDGTIGVTIGAFALFGIPVCDIQFYFSIPPASTNPEITLASAFGAAFVFNPNGTPSNVSSLSHTICSQTVSGGGSIVTDTPYIVRRYVFDSEKMPPDTIYFTQWSSLGWEYQKTARNLLLDIDTGGIAATVSLQADGGTVQTFSVNTTSNDRDRVLATNSNLEGKLWRLVITPGVTAGAKSQLFSAGLDYVPDVNQVTYIDTYEQSFGYPGWKFLKQVWLTYKGGPVTFQILTDGGAVFYSVTLPAHAQRDVERFYLPAVNAGVLNKSKKYRFKLTAASGLRLYANSSIEWFAYGSDQRGSFNLMAVNAEMQLPVAEKVTGMWSL